MVFYNENLAYKIYYLLKLKKITDTILEAAGRPSKYCLRQDLKTVLKTDVGYTHAMHGNSNKYLHVKKCKK